MQVIIISAVWLFCAIVAINLAYADGYRRGHDTGVASCCPEIIEPDEVAR